MILRHRSRMIVGDKASNMDPCVSALRGGRYCACLTVIARESIMDTSGCSLTPISSSPRLGHREEKGCQRSEREVWLKESAHGIPSTRQCRGPCLRHWLGHQPFWGTNRPTGRG